MSDGFKSIWLYDKILFSFFLLSFIFVNSSVIAQDREIIPYWIKIESKINALPGNTISLEIIKTSGSETAHGFDFVIGFDQSKLYNPTISSGELFDIPGAHEWEMLGSRTTPFPGCDQGGCPTGLIKIASLADTDNGSHHPVTDSETGKIKVIDDNTVLFHLNFQVADYLDPAEPFIPVFFFWTQCSNNQIAFSYDYDGPFDIRSAFSRSVFDTDGSPGWINISDYDAPTPSNQGAADICLTSELSVRLSDYFNGGVSWGCADINSDGRINILDVIFLINLKYKNGALPDIPEFADLNNDTFINILDIVDLINYLYKNEQQPNCPQP